MATSGRVYTGYITDSRFYVEWKQSKQDVAGNYTDISYTIGLNNGDWWYTNALKIHSVVIDGSSVLSDKTYSNITAQGDVVLATGTKRIYHGDNGAKTLSISISGWGYDSGNVSGSDSWPLTTIPRKTDISLSAPSVNFGNNITINCPKKASGFTNKLYYKINSGSWVLINANAGNSHVFNVAMSLIANIPNDMSCTFTIECDTYNGSTFIGSSTKTFTANVSSSARTAPKLNKAAILLRDESVSITLEPHAGTWQHIIAYSIGNASGYIQSTKTTNKSFTFTPSIDLAQQIPSATSGDLAITVYTYNGSGTLVGSTSASLKVMVPEDIVPTISALEVEEAVQLVQDNFDGFVQNLSQLLVSVVSSGAQGSSIVSCKTTVNGISYLGTEFTSGVITEAGDSIPVSAVVTDTRGRTSAVFTVKIKVIEYIYPFVSLDVDVVTGKVIINLAGAVSSVEEQNTRQLKLMYRAVTDETYTSEVIPLDAWSFDMSIERNIDASEVTYEFIAVLADKIETVTAAMLTGKVLMSRRAGGTGVTFGGEAETDGLVSNWDARFEKDVEVDGKVKTDGIEIDMTEEEAAEINTSLGTSGIKRLATLLKSIAYKLGLIADYVVEQGPARTSASGVDPNGDTTWYYKKYNSGYVEMVGYRESSIYTTEWSAWGSDYSSTFAGRAIPIPLTTLISSEGYIYDKTAYYTLGQLSAMSSSGPPTTTNTGYFGVMRSSKPGANMTAVRVVYKVWGLWK